MTDHEDTTMSHLLRQVPTAGQPPLGQIQARAQTLRRRRRGAMATVSVLAAVAIATPVVGAIGDQHSKAGFADAPTTTDEPPERTDPGDCGAQGDPDDRTAEALTLEEVPDEVRLLWSASAADAPASARAEDPYRHFDTFYPECNRDRGNPEMWVTRLYDVEGDVISRVIDVAAWEEGVEADSHAPAQSMVLNVDGTEVWVYRPEFTNEPAGAEEPERTLQVYWNGNDGELWRVTSTRDVTDDEIRDLVRSVALAGSDGIHFGDASIAGEVTLVIESPLSGSDEAPGYASYEASRPGLTLEVHELGDEDGGTMWADVGDMYLPDAINGRPAMVLTDPEEHTVRWTPVPGEVTASLAGHGYEVDELLEIARSIEPVPADDQRLTEVWGTCPAPGQLSSSLITPCDD